MAKALCHKYPEQQDINLWNGEYWVVYLSFTIIMMILFMFHLVVIYQGIFELEIKKS